MRRLITTLIIALSLFAVAQPAGASSAHPQRYTSSEKKFIAAAKKLPVDVLHSGKDDITPDVLDFAHAVCENTTANSFGYAVQVAGEEFVQDSSSDRFAVNLTYVMALAGTYLCPS